MSENLLSHPASELLRKFGSGNHKPGSGSAAALQALLSAQLIRTVIDLTKRRKPDSPHNNNLNEFNIKITNRLYPELERLCEEDSVIFDKVIKLRTAKKTATEQRQKDKLSIELDQATIPATEIPVKIAKIAIELGNYAVVTFRVGFKAARGDSGVALNGALSVISGCLSIIELNLLSFGVNEWTRKIRSDVADIKYEFEMLSKSASECLNELTTESRSRSFNLELTELRSEKWTGLRLSYKAIEELTKHVQNILWEYRDLLWKQNIPEVPIEVLRPNVAIEKLLGYQFQYATLGSNSAGDNVQEIAGEIDKQNKVVSVSRAYPVEVQNFTAAHELGHALLHEGLVLHRDRPMDGSSSNRDLQELQADKFATYFLMPAKQVHGIFQELFGIDKFKINQDNLFGLTSRSANIQAFRVKHRNLRGVAKVIASTEYFSGKSFTSLAKIFGVSEGAMAIRLEELELVEW